MIEKEKELIALIEPMETELEARTAAIDEEKEKLKRQELLPERRARLAEIDVVVDDEFILVMDDNRFNQFLNVKISENLAEKQRKFKEEREAEEKRIAEEKEKIEAEKRKLEEEKRIEAAKKAAEKEAQEKAERDAEIAKKKAEKEKADAVEAERLKAEAEKKKIIEEQERKERERLEAEQKAKDEAEAKAKKEKEDQERLEAQKKYQAFLKKHGYSEEAKADFVIQAKDGKITLFKKIGEIQL